MFIPTGIQYPYMGRPWATLAIFLLCVVLHLSHALEPDLPAGVALDPGAFAPQQLITNVFFHVGALHLLGNMLFLYVFGRYVEARLGPLKFLGLFFLASLVGDLVWLAVGPDAAVVGSSGAICGLIGFVLAVAPHNKLELVFMWGPRVHVDGGFQIAVGWMIAWWIGWDLFRLLAGETGGVAVLSHLCGYGVGFGVGYALSRPELEGSPWYVEPPPKAGDRSQARRLRIARGGGAGRAAREDDAGPRHEVVLRRLGDDTSPVGVVKLLMKHKGMAPEAAKTLVDAVAAGTAQVVGFETVDDASRFASDGRRLAVELNLRTAPARP